MRLRHQHNDLLDQLRRSSEAARRRAALRACEHALAVTGLHDEQIDAALVVLRQGRVLDEGPRRRLQTLVEKRDEQYLELLDEYEGNTAVPECRHRAAFRTWCAAAAVLFANGDDSLEAAAEAIYEALATERSASGSEDRLLHLIDVALKSTPEDRGSN